MYSERNRLVTYFKKYASSPRKLLFRCRFLHSMPTTYLSRYHSCVHYRKRIDIPTLAILSIWIIEIVILYFEFWFVNWSDSNVFFRGREFALLAISHMTFEIEQTVRNAPWSESFSNEPLRNYRRSSMHSFRIIGQVIRSYFEIRNRRWQIFEKTPPTTWLNFFLQGRESWVLEIDQHCISLLLSFTVILSEPNISPKEKCSDKISVILVKIFI